MNKYSCFEVQINDGIAHLIMNRPDQLNSMTRIFWKELPEIIKDIDKKSDARVLILSGQGKHFSAGMDFANFAPPKKSEKESPSRSRKSTQKHQKSKHGIQGILCEASWAPQIIKMILKCPKRS